MEVPASQDRVYVFLHRGAVVGGKEVGNMPTGVGTGFMCSFTEVP